ncbi:hypothetical protein NA56DRAFT_698075 [Hyaloscypha hepaticicola]|uniref:Uncharacterized protein n=1 Tax=Hyaloscypha hepaticicola TaxID=2082293 RepID=A0A2J6QKN6_9HELO|nr:hypothetical protein NA56DRAFT_698075 [Hyaloscypha hepaticicola]
MIHDPYYSTANNVRAGPRQDQHQFSSTPKSPSPAARQSILDLEIFRECLQRDSPFRGHPGGETHDVRSIITSFTFGLHLLSSASISTWLARSPIHRIPNSKFQKPLCSTLDACKLQQGFKEHNTGSYSSRPASCTTRLRRPGIPTLMKSRPRAAPAPQLPNGGNPTGTGEWPSGITSGDGR